MSTVTISTRTIGANFGCEGRVTRGSQVLHVTRPYPFGFDSQAYAAARGWANRNGYASVAYRLGWTHGTVYARTYPEAPLPTAAVNGLLRKIGCPQFGQACGLSADEIESNGLQWELATSDYSSGYDDGFVEFRNSK